MYEKKRHTKILFIFWGCPSVKIIRLKCPVAFWCNFCQHVSSWDVLLLGAMELGMLKIEAHSSAASPEVAGWLLACFVYGGMETPWETLAPGAMRRSGQEWKKWMMTWQFFQGVVLGCEMMASTMSTHIVEWETHTCIGVGLPVLAYMGTLHMMSHTHESLMDL